MTIESKVIPIHEIIKAAEDNGYLWRGHGANRETRANLESKCVLEQAALNLGLSFGEWANISEALDEIEFDLGRDIWHYNDDKAKSYKDAAAFVRRQLEPYGDKAITINYWKPE